MTRPNDPSEPAAARAAPAVLALLVALLASPAVAADDVKAYTRQTFDDWLETHAKADATFAAGEVVERADLEKLRPFVPPGYYEQLDFDGFRARIVEPGDYLQPKSFLECTEQHQSQVTLAANGALQNFVCGRPFPITALSTDDAETSGLKAAWNYNFRWQNFGLVVTNVGWIWDRFDGGTHSAPSWTRPPGHLGTGEAHIPDDGLSKKIYQGGGTYQRVLQGPYRRVYFSHLPQFRAEGGTLPGSDSAQFEFKEYTGFHEPFDIRGTAFIIYRYADPLRADDSWAYVPNLRRVRRISVETKSDSLLGTDHTLEDFYSFSGRVLDWNWKFLGWKKVLHVLNSRYDYSHYGGPKGIIPNDDQWELREYAVVERTPKNPRHPYSAVVMLWDKVTFEPSYSLAWDKKGKLWKVWQWQKKWTEDFEEASLKEMNQGKRALVFQSVQVLDVQNDRGTLVPCYGVGYPDVESEAQVARLYDISRLEELHR